MVPPSRFRFGPFVVERPSYRVLRDGHALTLSPKLVDVLLYFVSRPSTLVTNDELFSAIWPDVTVTGNALTQVISDLHQALGDEPSSPKYTQTVARDLDRRLDEIFDLQDRITAGIPGLDDSHRADVQAAERAA